MLYVLDLLKVLKFIQDVWIPFLKKYMHIRNEKLIILLTKKEIDPICRKIEAKSLSKMFKKIDNSQRFKHTNKSNNKWQPYKHFKAASELLHQCDSKLSYRIANHQSKRYQQSEQVCPEYWWNQTPFQFFQIIQRCSSTLDLCPSLETYHTLKIYFTDLWYFQYPATFLCLYFLVSIFSSWKGR